MTVKFNRKSGHKFFVFDYNGFECTVCVDGWINSSLCPDFCHSTLANGWEPLSNTGVITVFESSTDFTLVCPTSFGYVSRRGLYRTSGSYHTDFVFEKTGFLQFLHNYIHLGG